MPGGEMETRSVK